MTQPVTVGIDIGTSSVKASPPTPTAPSSRRRASRTRSRCPRRCGSSTTHASRGSTGLAPRSTRSATVDAVRCRGRGDGAVAHRGRRRRHPVHARPALRRRAGCSPGRAARTSRSSAASSVRFLGGSRRERPDARGYWPAQAVANFALCGEPVMSTTAAALAYPLFNWVGWDEDALDAHGRRLEQMPTLAPLGHGARRGRRADPGACSRAARSTRWASRSSRAPTTTATCS